MTLSKLALGGLAGVMLAGVASAQTTSPASKDQEIVVEGHSKTKQINRYVQQLTPAPIGAQLATFIDPVCPRVLGLPAADNGLVEERIRRVAAAIGAPVAPPRCTTNLYVLVGGDKAETIAGVRKQFPGLVAGVPGSLLRRLAEAPGPAAAWQVVDQIGSDGMQSSSVQTEAGSAPVRGVSTVGSPSRITRMTRPFVVGSVLIVEAGALDGVTTRQLADYAVMRTLAPTNTTRQAALPVDSIIKLFDEGTSAADAPPSVTWWDFAFLKSLYASSNEVVASQQRGEIGRQMKRELAKVPPEKQ
jgi:hypothetical protein